MAAAAFFLFCPVFQTTKAATKRMMTAAAVPPAIPPIAPLERPGRLPPPPAGLVGYDRCVALHVAQAEESEELVA